MKPKQNKNSFEQQGEMTTEETFNLQMSWTEVADWCVT